MPERISPLGRPPTYCTITCRRNADHVRTNRRLEEEHRAAMELRAAEAARAQEAERRRNLAAGGTRRLEQLQADAWDGNRCGWFEAGDDDVCHRAVTRAHLLWCRQHTDREEQLEEEALEAEIEAFEAGEAQLRSDATPSGRKTG